MRKIKDIALSIAFYATTLPIIASPIVGIAYFNIVPYTSGFVQAYNEVVQRNADTDNDGRITQNEELRFKQKLLSEIRELSRDHKMHRGKNVLRDIEGTIKYLEKR